MIDDRKVLGRCLPAATGRNIEDRIQIAIEEERLIARRKGFGYPVSYNKTGAPTMPDHSTTPQPLPSVQQLREESKRRAEQNKREAAKAEETRLQRLEFWRKAHLPGLVDSYIQQIVDKIAAATRPGAPVLREYTVTIEVSADDLDQRKEICDELRRRLEEQGYTVKVECRSSTYRVADEADCVTCYYHLVTISWKL